MTQPAPSYRLIYLNHGLASKVDQQDYDILNRHRWQARCSSNGMYYAIRARPVGTDGKHGTILMHREIMSVTDRHVFIDHINRDPLDNRRENLRIATKSQNKLNQKKRSDSKWPYKGISQPKGKSWWVANIQVAGVSKFLGCFKTPEAARDAYNEAAIILHGEFACTDTQQPVQPRTDDSALRAPRKPKGPRPVPRPAIEQPVDTSIRYISLPGGYFAIVDADDYEKQNTYHWRVLVNPRWGTLYANRNGYKDHKKFNIWLHKEVMGAGAGVIVDHVNGYGLDCRKRNLRIATRDENNRNHRVRKDSLSGLKGAVLTSCCKGRPWRASITVNKKCYHLGYFATPEESQAAYAKAANEHYGEFANY